jgi:hypothetical protein
VRQASGNLAPEIRRWNSSPTGLTQRTVLHAVWQSSYTVAATKLGMLHAVSLATARAASQSASLLHPTEPSQAYAAYQTFPKCMWPNDVLKASGR